MAGLKGKVAIVTASSQGLGKAIAKRFAQDGALVTICSRTQHAIEAAADEIEQATGHRPLALTADVNDPEAIKRVVSETMLHRGTIDILVNNAGGPPAGGFGDFDDQAWIKAHEQNLLSIVRFIREVLPIMKSQNFGNIINLTSSSVKQPIPGLILSNTYRTAVVGLAKTLADELGPFGIRVNNAAPGKIDTDRVKMIDGNKAKKLGVDIERVRQENEKLIPIGRYGTAEEFANAIAFLASDEASYITGVTLQVDGGMIKSLL